MVSRLAWESRAPSVFGRNLRWQRSEKGHPRGMVLDHTCLLWLQLQQHRESQQHAARTKELIAKTPSHRAMGWESSSTAVLPGRLVAKVTGGVLGRLVAKGDRDGEHRAMG